MAIKSKKGIFFTSAAIALVVVIVMSFVVQSEYKLRNKMYVIETRVETINNFIKDVEMDISRGLFITSFRALLGLQEYITTNGEFLSDLDSQFKETLLNGTLNGAKIGIMNGSTFTNWTKKIGEEAEKIDISIDFSITDISIYHQDPWLVTVDSILLINISDKKGTASWNRNKTVSINLSIEVFQDPLYTINSFGKVLNTIQKANETGFNSNSVLINHINNSYYVESVNGPDFLMRFEGITSNSAYGIESLVNLNKFFQQNLQTFDRSNVDYIYFGEVFVDNCVVNDTIFIFNWFRLDNDAEPNNHLDNYEVNCFS